MAPAPPPAPKTTTAASSYAEVVYVAPVLPATPPVPIQAPSASNDFYSQPNSIYPKLSSSKFD